MDRNHGMSRRHAVRLGFGAVATLVVATGASATENKLAKAAVQYTDVSTAKGMDCDDCTQFIPGKLSKGPASCRIVEGTISPHGHCIAFSPKRKS